MGDSLYQDIFENGSAAIAVLEKDATITMVNNAFCLLCGYTKDELKGSKWTDKLPSEEVERLKENIGKRILEGSATPTNFEATYITREGKLRTALFTVSVVKFSKKIILTFIDITENKETEEKLRLSEFFFKESQQAANIGSYKANFVTGKWESSQVLDTIFGIDASYDRSIDPGWSSIIHPDDRQCILNYLQQEVIGRKQPFSKEYRIIRKSDNRIRWVNGLGQIVFDKENNPVSLIGTIQDITDKKLAEEVIRENQIKLNIALKIARLGSWELNLEENLFHFNNTFYAIFKTSTKEIGKNTMTPQEYTERFVYPEDYYVVGSEIERALKAKESNYTNQLQHRMLYANGEMGYIEVRFAIVKDENGKTVKLFGINQDITPIIEAENKLKESEASLIELNSMKDKFFSIIAHDLKSPFSTILGFSEVLLNKAKEKDLKNIELYSNYVYQSSRKAFELLTNLMEWTQAETGRMKFAPQKLILNDVISEAAELLSPTAKKKNISIQIDSPEDLSVFADESMLYTIFRNLISNAIKFSFSKGSIFINAEEKEHMILIKVADNGAGMPKEIQDKLFRIDNNVSTKGTEDEEGTGLGLILCKEFVDKHGGDIWVESKEGVGSTFFFTIEKQKKN